MKDACDTSSARRKAIKMRTMPQPVLTQEDRDNLLRCYSTLQYVKRFSDQGEAIDQACRTLFWAAQLEE